MIKNQVSMVRIIVGLASILMLLELNALGQDQGKQWEVLSGETSQEYNPLESPNSYRSEENPYYWKNNKPYSDYWQQDVHYRINADLDDKANSIEGKEKLTYWNNSRDTLNKVYFHLYQNAFQPGSYYHLYRLANNSKPKFGIYEKQGLGTAVKNLKVNGQEVETDLDNTLLIVNLPEPLYPNDSMNFEMDFETFFDNGSMWRRMKMFKHHGVKHFNAVHWYPRMAAYDRKFGWHLDQHLGKEFYGDFGTFDVSLTLPQEYIVEGTGNIVNRDQVLPEQLMSLLQIENYQDSESAKSTSERLDKYFDRPRGHEGPSQAGDEATRTKKTWRFHAENVHDFAFTADPTYRMGIEETGDIRCVALVQEHKAANWQETANFIKQVVEVFYDDFGEYPYHKIVAADARDGMEYPMLTLCGGKDPGNRYLIAHEVGHNWFYGAVGTNETYRAAMDEGFTQMLTAWALDRIEGENYATPRRDNWYQKMFTDTLTNKERSVYYHYLSRAIKDDDARLNVHSNKYNSATGHGGGYRQVYYKMATMLYNLQYVLGDELFLDAMKNYFNNWKIAHPYFEDFRNSIINYTDVDLNWFFDQWFNTKKSIDYKVKNVRKGDEDGEYSLTFERKGEMEMPLDVQVTTKDGEEYNYIIPNTYFAKNTDDAKVLPKWTGWGKKFNTTYEANIEIDGKIDDVVIDPSNRLADVYKPDNSKSCNVDLKFDSKVSNYSDQNNYELRWRPDIWYNEIDGLKTGLHLNGDYMDYKHQFHLTGWYNSGVFDDFDEEGTQEANTDDIDRMPVNFNAWYKTPLTSVDPDLFFNAGGKILDGLYEGYIGFDKSFGEQDHFSLRFKTSIRPNAGDLDYLLYPASPEDDDEVIYPDLWDADQWNNTLALKYTHDYDYTHGNGKIQLGLLNSSIGSDYNYSRLNMEVINQNQLDKLRIKTRTYAEYTLGNNIAPQSQLFMAGARPDELMENKYTRSRAFFPTDWTSFGPNTNHFHYGGGLNLRGYAGYVATYITDDNEQKLTYAGNAGASVNAEVEFDRYIPFRPNFLKNTFDVDLYLFGDAGIMNHNDLENELELAKIRADAGLGSSLTIKDWGPLDEVQPLTIRFDMPFYISHAPAVDDSNLDFRWILGVKRAF